MKEERYFYVPNAHEEQELPQEEAVHASRVLRLKEGDTIYVMDGKGGIFPAELTLVTNKRCEYSLKSHYSVATPTTAEEKKISLTLAMAPTKMMERVELVAEKATEIGVDEFAFPECQFSERRKMRSDRIEKIVVSAMKQSRRAFKPVVREMEDFQAFIDSHNEGQCFICHCYKEIERTELTDIMKNIARSDKEEEVPQKYTIMIGPEGDFSIEEVKYAISKGYQSISLGTSRLRTETAALVASTIIIHYL